MCHFIFPCVQDLKDPLELLHPRNVNKTALYEYIRHGGTRRPKTSRLYWITTGMGERWVRLLQTQSHFLAMQELSVRKNAKTTLVWSPSFSMISGMLATTAPTIR
jgi:hypothetical protein